MSRKIGALSKKIKEGIESYEDISNVEEINNIEKVVNELERLPRIQETNLEDLRMGEVQKDCIKLLLGTNQKLRKHNMNSLLMDFTDAMQTRMRETDKYAISLSMNNKLVMCHSSFGGETITPQWKTIPRMLDTGNVMRYVCFSGISDSVKVKFWEREASQLFVKWLGIPSKMGYLAGGNCKIQVRIEDIVTEFQFDENEIEQFLVHHPELMNGVIELKSTPKRLTIEQILHGQKPYKNMGEFIQAWEALKNDIPYYKNIYDKLESKAVFWIKYFDSKTHVTVTEGGQEKLVTNKPSPGDMIFANGNNILFDLNYLTDLINRMSNEELIKVVHLGLDYMNPPFRTKNLEIYNSIKVDRITKLVVEYFEHTNIQDKNLNIIMQFTVLELLASSNYDSPICYFFNKLAEGIIGLVSLNGIWTKKEEVIEYKPADYFSGNDELIIDKLKNDLEKKFKIGTFKIYLIGVEDNGTLNPIFSGRLKSDRINSIERSLQAIFGIYDIHIFPVIQDKAEFWF